MYKLTTLIGGPAEPAVCSADLKGTTICRKLTCTSRCSKYAGEHATDASVLKYMKYTPIQHFPSQLEHRGNKLLAAERAIREEVQKDIDAAKRERDTQEADFKEWLGAENAIRAQAPSPIVGTALDVAERDLAHWMRRLIALQVLFLSCLAVGAAIFMEGVTRCKP